MVILLHVINSEDINYFLTDPFYKNDVRLFQIYLKGNHMKSITMYKHLIAKSYISISKIIEPEKQIPELISIIGNCTQNQIKKCLVTGIDLKLEKGNEKHVKAKTIKGLKKYVKDTYIMICSSLLNNTSSNLPM